MFDIIKYKYISELRKLQKKKEKNRRLYRKLIDDSEKAEKSRDEIYSLGQEQNDIEYYIDEQIIQVQHKLVVHQAEKCLIPVPEYNTKDGTWEESSTTGRWRLSQTSIFELKKAIQEERKSRRDHWQSWLTLLIGLIGALIGLFSLLG